MPYHTRETSKLSRALWDRLVQPDADDPLIAPFKHTAAEAEAAGLTQDDINAEPAAHKAERRG